MVITGLSSQQANLGVRNIKYGISIMTYEKWRILIIYELYSPVHSFDKKPTCREMRFNRLVVCPWIQYSVNLARKLRTIEYLLAIQRILSESGVVTLNFRVL
jgi:hypothetical protein